MLLDRLKATGCIFALFLGVFALSSAAQAGPEDGRIVNGSGSISQSGTHTDIRQNSDFLATHWGSFNIAAHESVQAHQPGASSRLLIRVDGGGTGTGGGTNIAGRYTSNGITILENQNGVQFSRGAIVNVGGLLATSSRISGATGANWQLNGTGGAVVNHGQIAAGAGGVVLAAVRVENHGKITAQGSNVSLGAGAAFTVDFAGSLVGFEVKKAADGASVVHDGVIESQGGIVSLSAQEAQAVRTNVVSVGGVVKATRIERRGGVVYLSGGTQGIAEVLGDVQADDKVQATGEYVVVKDGALLKAPKILVGGDFQGKGDVPTSRRTLVERGALLNAGKDGRVIVWSDETTWFNGDISAPEGFAEVSGKQTLASVNLAGIDVGELLLDPADIIIAATGTAVSNSIASGDPPSDTLTLAVADINSFPADLTLAASDTIMVNAAINKRRSGALILTAGGVLTLNDNINTGTGDLALGGGSIVLGNAITLDGGAITLTGAIDESSTGNDSLTIRASGVLTLNNNIDTGRGNLTLSGTSIVLSAPVELMGAAISLTGAIDESADTADANGKGGNDNLTITATGDITINDDINLGPDGELTLFAGMGGDSSNRRNILSDPDNTETLTAGTVSLRQDAAFGDTFAGPTGTFRISTSTLNLRASAPQRVRNWMVVLNRSLSITSGVRVEVGEDIVLGTGDLTLRGRLIGINGARTLSGGAISLEDRIESFGSAITITATGALTLNDNINTDTVDHTSTGDLALSGGSIVLGNAITLDGGAITLTGAIDGSSTGNDSLTIRASGVLTLNDNINTGTGDLALSGGSIVLGGTAPITLSGGAVTLTGAINPFFRISAASLTVTATGQLTLNSDIKTGRRIDLTLSGRTITLGGTINLSGGAITLTGAIDASDDGYSFTITADGGNITINNSINLGEGILNLGASGFSEVTGSGTPTLTASTVALRNGVVFSQNAQFRFATNTLSLTVGGIQTVYDWMVADGRNLRLRANGGVIVTGDINIGSATLIFEVCCGNIHAIGTGTPTLTAGAVSFTQSGDFAEAALFRFASSVRALNLTTDALNLPPGVETQAVHGWMVADGRSLSLTTTFGAIMVNADINTGTGNLTLSGSSGISINGARTLRGAAITLTGEILRAGNAALVITATGGALTFNSSFNTGTGALTLSGTSIVLGGTAPITLSGGAVTLTGAAMGAANLTITASSTLRLNNNITLTGTTSILDLSGAGVIGNGSTARVLTAGTVSLTQDAAFGSPALFTFGADTSSLELTTTANQDVLNWMIEPDRNLTVTSSNRVRVMGAIGMDESDRNIGGGDLTLTSTGGAVRILGGISTTGDVTITASGTLTIDSDINIGANALTLTSGAGAIVATGRPRLTAGMVSFSQVDALPVTRPFRFSPGSSLAITTEALQDVHDWMIIENIDLTVTSSNRVRVVAIIGTGGVAGRNLGTGSITLTSTGGDVRILANISITNNITLSGGAGGINLNGTATLTGAAITLTGDARGNRDLTLDASGTLRINSNITLTGAGNLALSSDTVVRILANITTGGNITLSGGTNGINLNSGAAAKTLSGAAITLTGDARSNRDLTINASGTLTLNGGINTGTSALSLSGSSVALGGALTLTGGDITLTGAATGTADLTLTASGILTLNNDINIGTSALTLTSGVGAIVATGRPRLTAGMVSFSQVDALPVTRPFRFIPSSSLAITTEAAQDVHDWMIRENIDLTVTSSNRVRVVAIIGTGGVAGRNLGTGALSLTSTGGAVRILANISTTGGLTLSGVTGGINLNGGAAKTLAGAIITLTGDARGNRDLTITATGVLTINNNINIGTSTLSLTGTNLTFGANVDLTAGDHIFDPTRTCDGSTADPTCTDTTP